MKDGEVLPSVHLKGRSRVQSGTVATMLYNINLYNAGERELVEKELALAVPMLVKVGLFDLFSIEDWIAGTNPGRHFVGECARNYLT